MHDILFIELEDLINQEIHDCILRVSDMETSDWHAMFDSLNRIREKLYEAWKRVE